MSIAASGIRVSGLGKQKLAELRQNAKGLGMSLERYAKHLIENGLRLEQQARTTSFDDLLEPLRAEFRKSGVTEDELDRIVDAARTRHHRRKSKRKR